MKGERKRSLKRRMCFSGKACRQMLIAGYLHDLGKVAVPNAILNYVEKLSSVVLSPGVGRSK